MLSPKEEYEQYFATNAKVWMGDRKPDPWEQLSEEAQERWKIAAEFMAKFGSKFVITASSFVFKALSDEQRLLFIRHYFPHCPFCGQDGTDECYCRRDD